METGRDSGILHILAKLFFVGFIFYPVVSTSGFFMHIPLRGLHTYIVVIGAFTTQPVPQDTCAVYITWYTYKYINLLERRRHKDCRGLNFLEPEK